MLIKELEKMSSGYKFAAVLITGKINIGHIYANSMQGLKQKASRICNGYFHSLDELHLYKANNTVFDDPVLFTRFNKIYPNNTIIRGKW